MKLQDYINSDRKGKEARQVELAAMDDPFLSEALEGYDAVEGDHGEALERLTLRLEARFGERWPARRPPFWRRRTVWAGAASITIVFFISVVFYRQFIEENEMSIRDLAFVEEVIPITHQDAPPGRQAAMPARGHDSSSVTGAPETAIILDQPPIFPDKSIEITVPMEMSFEDFNEDIMIPVASPAPEAFPAADVSVIAAAGGDRTVTGRVTDDSGQPLAGAYVAAGANGTASGIDGGFSLRVPEGTDLIEVRMLGFKTSGVKFGDGDTYVDIRLQEDEQSIDEVVVTGMGTQRRQMLTGSVRGIDAKEAGKVKSKLPKPAEPKTVVVNNGDTPDANGFIATEQLPVTALGIDTGSESYRRIRGLINQARKPSPADVNTGEIVNYFYYTYEKPSSKDAVDVTYEIGDCPWNTGNKLVIVAVTPGATQGKGAVRNFDLNVTVNPVNVSSYRLIGYDGAGEGQPFINLPSGPPEAGKSLLALYEIVPAAGMDTVGTVMNLDLSYKQSGSRKTRSLHQDVKLTGIPPSDNFWFASAVAMFGEILKGADSVGDAGFDLVIETANKGITPENAASRKDFIKLVEAARDLAQ